MAAGSALLLSGGALLLTEALRRVVELSPEQLLDTLNTTASEDEHIEEELCELYATVVRERRTANLRRRKWLSGTQLLAAAGALIILAELIYGLNARV